MAMLPLRVPFTVGAKWWSIYTWTWYWI